LPHFDAQVLLAMDTPLRTRLIGAAVLFGLLAIFLPMFMHSDQPSDPATAARGEEIPLDIPTPPAPGMETRVLPIEPAAPIAEQPANSENNPAASALPEPPRVSPIATPSQGSIARDSAPSAASGAQATPAIPDISAPPEVSTALPASSQSQPALRLPAPVPGGRFGVNFGSYSSQGAAEKLIDQLAALKIKARIELVDGKNLFRVTTRGFGNRTDAEKTRLVAQDGIANLSAALLQDNPESDAAPANVVPANVAAFAVQIGVFADKGKAASLVSELKAKGFAAFSDAIVTPAGTSMRVRVGPMVRRADAEKLRAEIKLKAKLDGIVVAHS
jgi:DedD protein